MLDVSREEIVGGSLGRSLTLLALPLVAQNLVQVVNQVVDLFWLGRLSETAVAGVGLVVPVLGVLFGLLLVAVVGTQIVVSQRTGAGDSRGARRGAVNGLCLALAVGLVAGGVTAVSAGTVVAAFRPDASVADFARPYLATYAVGLPAVFVADTMEAVLVGVGDSRGSFYLNAVAVGLNVLLDPLLIFGWGPLPRLGVRGAAAATVVGYAVGAALAAGLLVRGRAGLRITRGVLSLRLETLREIVGLGAPNAAQRVGQQVARLLVVGIVSAVGGAAGLAAYTVGARVATIAFVPAQGLQQAAQSVIGQNVGAGRGDRARRATWIGVGLAAGALAVVGAVQWRYPAPIASALVPGASAPGAALTVDYLRILAYGYPAIGVTYLVIGGFNAARRTRTSMALTLLQYWGVRLPIAAAGAFGLGWLGIDILGSGIGVHAVFWAVTLSNVAAAAGGALHYRGRSRAGMLDRAVAEAAAAADD